MKRYYEAEIEFPTINEAGEDVTYTIAVSYFYRQEPDPYADSDVDYYGYTEMEWDLLDENRKVVPTPDECNEDIEQAITDHYEAMDHDL